MYNNTFFFCILYLPFISNIEKYFIIGYISKLNNRCNFASNFDIDKNNIYNYNCF